MKEQVVEKVAENAEVISEVVTGKSNSIIWIAGAAAGTGLILWAGNKAVKAVIQKLNDKKDDNDEESDETETEEVEAEDETETEEDSEEK